MERLTLRIAASVEIAAEAPLLVAELLAGADGAEGNVVGHHHPDGTLDLRGGGAHHRAERGGGGDGPVDDVVDLVKS